MKWVFIILGVILVLAALLLPIFLLFTQPLPADNWLVAVRDTSIIYATMFMCVGAILFIVMTALIAFIAWSILRITDWGKRTGGEGNRRIARPARRRTRRIQPPRFDGAKTDGLAERVWS